MKQCCFLVFLSVLSAGIYAQNVGIGTNTPLVPLHISHPTDTALVLVENQSALGIGINNGIYFRSGTRYTGAIKTIGTSTLDARMGLFTFSTSNANLLREYLSVLDDGKVGIGITTPSALLDVNGTFRLRGNGAASGNVLTSDANGNGTWQPATPAPVENTGFSVTATAAVIIGDDFSAIIPFNNKSTTFRFDDGNNFNVASNAFIAPTNGVYSFTINAGIAAGIAAADGHIRLSVLVDGFSRNTPSCEIQTFAGKPLPRTGSLTLIVKLVAGEALTVQMFNNTGANISTDIGSRCNLSGYRLY